MSLLLLVIRPIHSTVKSRAAVRGNVARVGVQITMAESVLEHPGHCADASRGHQRRQVRNRK